MCGVCAHNKLEIYDKVVNSNGISRIWIEDDSYSPYSPLFWSSVVAVGDIRGNLTVLHHVIRERWFLTGS